MAEICTDCGKTLEIGDWPFPCRGRGHDPGPFWRGDAQIHSSQKVTIYESPTGQLSDAHIPGRADRPMNPKLAAAGFKPRVLDTQADVNALCKAKGLIHEPGNFSDSTSHAMKATGSR